MLIKPLARGEIFLNTTKIVTINKKLFVIYYK